MALDDYIQITREMLEKGVLTEKQWRQHFDKLLSDQYDHELLRQQKQAFRGSSLTMETIKQAQHKLNPRRRMYKITVILPPTVTWRDRLMTMEVSQLEQTFRYSLMKPLDYHAWTPERLATDEKVDVLSLQARRIVGTVYKTY